MPQLESSALAYKGNVNVASFLLDQQKEIAAKSIQQLIIIETGNMAANEDHRIDFDEFGMGLKPLSLYLSTNRDREESLQLTVEQSTSNGTYQIIRLGMNKADIPFLFPPIALTATNILKIRPNYDIDNCFIVFEPCSILYLKSALRASDSNEPVRG